MAVSVVEHGAVTAMCRKFDFTMHTNQKNIVLGRYIHQKIIRIFLM